VLNKIHKFLRNYHFRFIGSHLICEVPYLRYLIVGPALLLALPVSSVGDPDPQDPHVLGLQNPDPLVRGTDLDPAPDPYLF